MQISPILNIAPSTAGLTTVAPEPDPVPSSLPPAAAAQASSVAAPIQASTSSSGAVTVPASYSVTLGGRLISGSVDESGGAYTAAVPGVPGAIASGSSLSAVEISLNLALDELV